MDPDLSSLKPKGICPPLQPHCGKKKKTLKAFEQSLFSEELLETCCTFCMRIIPQLNSHLMPNTIFSSSWHLTNLFSHFGEQALW